ncbi:hypothetical protein SAMN04487967_0903 [Natronorubrum sediminis]|uniref:Membrane domain of glycerophosphoryl diester phosphodiesterase n=1 Tax=Natronorubrum sediminis TaxID=640943 RepID=A0A1H6FSC8_9EURY|nr:DUF6159 family protein [Natronorubrum sediminis]SEH12655.1 hypothetical protein SAMN04487967_0903 [Natronorubrum sediminis]
MAAQLSLRDRLRMGVAITRGSFRTLRQRKWLFAFPILYGLTWVVGLGIILGGIFVALIAAGYALAALESFVSLPEGTADDVAMAVLFASSAVFLFITSSVATFFSATLVHSVGNIFTDEQTGVRDGLAGAWGAKRTILAWGGVGAVVGMVIRILENRTGRGSRFVQSTLGFAWSAMTFFIVPVIVFQEGGLRESVRNSLEIFRQTWGEAAVINLGVGLVMFPLIAIIGFVGIGAPALLLEEPGTVLTITAAPTLVLVGIALATYQAATGVAKTALYYHATGKPLPEEFGDIDPTEFVSQSVDDDRHSPESPAQQSDGV